MDKRPASVEERDWLDWHQVYNDPGSSLSWRLRIVRDEIRAALDRCPAGRIQVISICAGQGHDLIGSVAAHPRREDVSARLVELDPRNTQAGSQMAAATNLGRFEFVAADASITDVYAGAVPAQLALVCGLFGNITDGDIATTISALPSLLATDGTVIWTRHRHDPDVTPNIRRWFRDAGFNELAFHRMPDGYHSVGVHQLTEPTAPFHPGLKFFRFVGYDTLLEGRS